MSLPPNTPVAAILDNEAGWAVLAKYAPDFAGSPHLETIRDMPLDMIIARPEVGLSEASRAQLWQELHALSDAGLLDVDTNSGEVFEPDPGYENGSLPIGSASVRFPSVGRRWDVFEIELRGPEHGNPFVDVELSARFTNGDSTVHVGGFYDGEGVYRVRFLPPLEGEWTFVTSSTARSLDSIGGTFHCGSPGPSSHGPVGVVDGFHFAYADGTRYTPIGTTSYAWSHQGEELEQKTLRTLAGTSFNKIRMCVFPKSFAFNENEPRFYPFPGSSEEGWDTTRFRPEFFRHLEDSIRYLDSLGIQADVILFHPYDRWGFSKIDRAGNERYLRYLTRRLAALPNVWWSMANEYDLVWAQTNEDWERLAQIVQDNDHVGHLRSIHNYQRFYDYTQPWITHCSVQRTDVYRTSENTTRWREQWGKPVVVDECGYEGNVDQAWGNLTGEEMVRRFWEGAVRGGYVGHGETYINDRDELWWSKGGELVGSSPARIAFLAALMAESPTGTLEPLDLGAASWDVPWGGVDGLYCIGYFGLTQPSYFNIDLPPGEFVIDVIDTWNMTRERTPGLHAGGVRVELPGRPYTALRLVRIEEPIRANLRQRESGKNLAIADESMNLEQRS
jgi:hypothetical protein